MTLVELLLATVLLGVAAVPIVQAFAHGLATSREVETRTRAMLLAQQQMETAVAAAMANFSQNLGAASQNLGGGYLATVVQTTKTSTTKLVTVQVGFDTNKNNVLETSEVLVTFGTLVVDTGG
jgi:type II secretory pathway pseudopilin PulG